MRGEELEPRTGAGDRLHARTAPPKIYYLHPLLAGPLPHWRPHLERAAGLGFTHIDIAPPFQPDGSGNVFLADDFEKPHPLLGASSPADGAVADISAACRELGLALLIDIVLDRVARGGAMARSAPRWFRENVTATNTLDPRRARHEVDAADANFEDPAAGPQLIAWWIDRLVRLAQAGAEGFRLLGLDRVPAAALATIVRAVRTEVEACKFLGWTPGIPRTRIAPLRGLGLDHVFASTPWWDGRAAWLVEEHEALRHVAPAIGVAEAPFAERLASRAGPSGSIAQIYRRALRTAAATGNGILVPMGFEFASRIAMDAGKSAPEDLSQAAAEPELDLSDDIKSANALIDKLAALNMTGETRQLNGPASSVTALLKADAADVRGAEHGVVVLINTDDRRPRPIPANLDPLDSEAGTALGHPQRLDGGVEHAPLAPGEVRIVSVERTLPVGDKSPRNGRALTEATKAPRVVIDRVDPHVEGGPFAVKRVIGQSVTV